MASDGEVFNPSAELARMHIRSAVEHLLQYPPAQGKYALDSLTSEVESEYFPTDVKKAVVAFESSPLNKARDSLIRNFTIVLLKKLINDAKDYKEIYIETERIIIRNFKQKDAEGLLEYLSHPRVNCFAGDRLCSREAAWAYMQYSPKDMLRYAVSLKKDDFIIGDVFALRENEDTYNVGWHFNKRFEGKGFACEAAAGLLDYLFREAGARRIYGFVEDDNIRSKRLCERLGMRREGCFKEFVTFVNNPDGSPKYEDTCVYAILEKEWNTIRQW